MNEKVALVTGASAGIGQATAERLVKEGYCVYGTSRRSLPDTQTGVRMRVLEITEAASVAACIRQIMDEAGRIDVLVNNAGRFQTSILEETPIEEIELLLQTNFLGAVRVNQAVLPIMRAQRSGRLIMVGSLAGLVGLSGMGYTSAVKHALEGYAEALRVEVEAFGIQVSILEPSYFKTEIYSRRIASENAPQIEDYNHLRQKLGDVLQKEATLGDDPSKAADKIIEIMRTSKPRLRYPVGKQATLYARLKRYMPEALFLQGMRARIK